MRTKTLSEQDKQLVNEASAKMSREHIAANAHVSLTTLQRMLRGRRCSKPTYFAVIEAARKVCAGEV